MTQSQTYQPCFRWFTSELSFSSTAEMIRAKNEIEAAYKNQILVEPADHDVYFSGTFDLAEEGQQTLTDIFKQYINQPYRIKVIYAESNGYFGGHVCAFDRNGNLEADVSLNQLFEEGIPVKTEKYVMQIDANHKYITESCKGLDQMKEIVKERAMNTDPTTLTQSIRSFDENATISFQPVSKFIESINTSTNQYFFIEVEFKSHDK